MRQIKEEDFSAWKDNEVTQAVSESFKYVCKVMDDAWVDALRNERMSPDHLMRLRVEINAKQELINDFLNLELEDILEDKDNAGSNVIAIGG